MIPTWYENRTPPVPSLQMTQFDSIGLPVLAICSQRVVIDLRRIQPAFYGTEEVSKEINRQIGALSLNIHHTRDKDQLSATREGDSNADNEETRTGPARIFSGDNRNEV